MHQKCDESTFSIKLFAEIVVISNLSTGAKSKMFMLDYRDKLSWINRLTPEQWQCISTIMRDVTFQEKNTIYHEASAPKGAYYIKEGTVKLSSVDSNGSERYLAILGQEASFGESALFAQRPHRCSAIARSEVLLGFIPRAELRKITSRNVGIANLILEIVSQRHSRALEMSLKRERLGLAERIATTLIGLLRVQSVKGQTVDRHVEYVLNLTQNEVAAILGASRQSINKIVGRWCEEGVIRLEYGQINIISLEKLDAYASEPLNFIQPDLSAAREA